MYLSPLFSLCASVRIVILLAVILDSIRDIIKPSNALPKTAIAIS